VTETNRAELEAFWRAHLNGWAASDLNQREYCEAYGLPQKRFENWRAKFRHETPAPARRLLYRRGGGANHMLKPMPREIPEPVGYIPSALLKETGRRRSYSTGDKRRIVGETCREGATVSGVARKYRISPRLLFHWKQEFDPKPEEPVLLPVTISDAPGGATPACLSSLQVTTAQAMRPAEPASAPVSASVSGSISGPVAGPVIVERSTPGIEIELIGGRRVRFERDVDPETVRRLVAVLEGDAR